MVWVELFHVSKIKKMKTKSIATGLRKKISLIIFCCTIGFSRLMVVDAQSAIVGKWTEVSAKQFFTPEGAKQAGKPVIESKPHLMINWN